MNADPLVRSQACLDAGQTRQALRLLKDHDHISSLLMLAWISTAIGKGRLFDHCWARITERLDHCSSWDPWCLLRYLRIRRFMGDRDLPAPVLTAARALGAALPLWADHHFAVHSPGRGAAMLDFGEFLFLPIPKNASSTIAALWVRQCHGVDTIDPHRFYPSPFTHTCDPRSAGDGPAAKPVVAVLRSEGERLVSYYNGNIQRHHSLERDPGVERFLGLSVRPGFDEFRERRALYSLVFDDCLHHLLPAEAYLAPLGCRSRVLVEHRQIGWLASLFPATFPPGCLDHTRLMASVNPP
ncbi:MAG: hypothetical protein ACKOPN_04425 [Prochlorococcaceae cyanobacterium]